MTVSVGIDVSAIPDDPRGAGRYVIELVSALHRRREIELHLQTRRHDGKRWSALAPGSDVRAVVPDSRPKRLAWEQIAGPRFVDRWGVDVHHGPHYTMPEVARLPRVVTVHDLTFFDHPEWHEKVKVAVFKRAIRAAAKLADAIVCVSAPTARRLHELLDPQCPVHVIPHGIDHERFNATDDVDDLARLAAVGVRPPYVAFWGTLEPRKDVATLVAAFDRIAADHPDLQLAVGGGSGWGNDAFEQAVARSPHAGRIARTGYLPDATLPAFARRAEAVVYAAFEEGFGLPAIEALACGARALVTTEGSVMDELTAGAAWLAPAGDGDALASVLDRLLSPTTADERTRKRDLGLEVATTFTWEATAAAHERVYVEVASGRR